MSTQTIVVNPDRFIADRALKSLDPEPEREPHPREMTPQHYRQKLRDAGVDPKLARAEKPSLPRVRIDWAAWEARDRLREQIDWTRMLVRLVSR